MSDVDRIPAETFPPGEFLADELKARGWSHRDLAERMGGDTNLNHCMIDLLVYAPNKGVIICQETSAAFGSAFGVSEEYFRHLDAAWRGEPNDS